jgi:hypothetical protein
MRRLPELDQDRGDLDLADPADRLSDGLRHRAPVARRAQRGDDAGGAAVVDLVPDPRVCVEGILDRNGLLDRSCMAIG